MNILFFVNSLALGVALAMDAFSVSIANAIADPAMRRSKKFLVAGTFSFFQIIMPLIGWFCVHTIAETFSAFQKYIPWIALILLVYIGGNMLREAFSGREDDGKNDENKAAQDMPSTQDMPTAQNMPAAHDTPAGQKTPAEQAVSSASLTLGTLMLQGIATSIDALSVGFTIAQYTLVFALTAALIIGVVTFFICIAGLEIGIKIGEKFSKKASVLGGVILICIGLEIFIRSFL